jgi:serine/threonine protein kinase
MINKEALYKTYGLEIQGDVIYQSSSKLTLAAKSKTIGNTLVALKFSKLEFELHDTYVSNFLKVSNLNYHKSILDHQAIYRLDKSVFNFDLLEVLELILPVSPSDVFGKEIPIKTLKLMILQLLKGFCFLHSQGILHRDVKPANILLIKDHIGYNFKIIDFDFTGCESSQRLFTTPEFLAPEVDIFSDYDAKAEIWAMGAVLYLIFVGNLPFSTRLNELSIREVRRNVLNATFDFSKVPTPLKIPLSLCLKKNPSERIGNLGLLIFIIDPFYFLKSRLKRVFSKSLLFLL